MAKRHGLKNLLCKVGYAISQLFLEETHSTLHNN